MQDTAYMSVGKFKPLYAQINNKSIIIPRIKPIQQINFMASLGSCLGTLIVVGS